MQRRRGKENLGLADDVVFDVLLSLFDFHSWRAYSMQGEMIE
jgi:hypothetical protein